MSHDLKTCVKTCKSESKTRAPAAHPQPQLSDVYRLVCDFCKQHILKTRIQAFKPSAQEWHVSMLAC